MKRTLDQIAGENFKAIRLAKKISQTQIGKSTNIAQSSISNLEKRGEIGSATLATLDVLSDYLKIPAYILLMDGIEAGNVDEYINDLVKNFLKLSSPRRRQVAEYVRDLAKIESTIDPKQI